MGTIAEIQGLDWLTGLGAIDMPKRLLSALAHLKSWNAMTASGRSAGTMTQVARSIPGSSRSL
jgi:hypothetical protein